MAFFMAHRIRHCARGLALRWLLPSLGLVFAGCDRATAPQPANPSRPSTAPVTAAPAAEPARPLGAEALDTARLRETAARGSDADKLQLAAHLDRLIGEHLGNLDEPDPWSRIEVTQREVAELRAAAARNGSADAKAHLALAYLTGRGVTADTEQARRLADTAAAAGAPRAWVVQGQLLAGQGQAAEACALFRKAASRDDAAGLFYTGACAAYGWDGQPPSFAKGRPLLERAVAAGDPHAPAVLAERLRHAPDAVRDAEQALELLRLGARRGSVQAMTELARTLWFDAGAQRDPVTARRWLERAARAGHAAARWHYALALEQGAGGPANPVEALLWYELALDGAAGEHVEFAQAGRDRLAARLADEQKAAVRTALRDFTPKSSVAALAHWAQPPDRLSPQRQNGKGPGTSVPSP